MFENIQKLQFDASKKILGMYSVENEYVEFNSNIDPKHKQVEDWMKLVEIMMCESVRKKLQDSVTDYKLRERNAWILLHPSQCVLNGS